MASIVFQYIFRLWKAVLFIIFFKSDQTIELDCHYLLKTNKMTAFDMLGCQMNFINIWILYNLWEKFKNENRKNFSNFKVQLKILLYLNVRSLPYFHRTLTYHQDSNNQFGNFILVIKRSKFLMVWFLYALYDISRW
jgi:hypothetical protein